MHSYDNDPIHQAGLVNAFNSGLNMVTLGIAGLLGDTPVTPDTTVKLSDLGTLVEGLQKPVPAIPDAYVAWAASGPLDDAPTTHEETP